jgi:biopolymer transport protein ExbD
MPLKTQQDEQPTLNLTPMIDVVFLLIIFFMAATKFTSDERALDVKVPQVGNTSLAVAPTERRVINVSRDGAILLNSVPVTLDELTAQLRDAVALQPRVGVNVRGDGEGNFQSVATVLDACRQAGVQDMAISVRVARRIE